MAAQIHLQWFVNEQVEEEKSASELIAQLEMSGDQAPRRPLHGQARAR